LAVKRGLGKGISALLPEAENQDIHDQIMENWKSQKTGEKPAAEAFIPLDKIKANPLQPRKNFNDEELAELADSIREHGIIQPVIVEESEDGAYTIVAGERRIRAARMAGLSEAPAIIRKYSEEKRMAVALIENIQRSGLNPIEEAAAYKQLMDLANLSQDEAAARVGKNRSTVANALRLLKLPAAIQESISKGEISAGHARAILSVTGSKAQETLYSEILKGSLSVREAEKMAALMGTAAKTKAAPTATTGKKPRAPELEAMEEKFLSHLGTKVKINGDLNQGSIIIEYYSMEDLERLYELLG